MYKAASTNLPFLVCAEKRVFIGLALVGCRAKALISFAPDCNVKSIAPRRTVINNLILTTMTHISQFAVKDFDAYENSNELKEYQVEVITFDGESETVYVEAYNEDEASNIAAARVGNADYTMVYSYN